MENFDKQDGKISAIYTLGAYIEDQLEKYRKELLGLEGTKQALSVLANKLETYITVIDTELTEKKITFTESSVAKRHVATCIRIIKELGDSAMKQQTLAEGKISASDFYVQKFKEMFDEEKQTLDTLKHPKAVEALPEQLAAAPESEVVIAQEVVEDVIVDVPVTKQKVRKSRTTTKKNKGK